MQADLVSVIVTIYNTAKYLDECISSICNQTYKNLEILLVNDGSTDNSLEICRAYECNDNRITVLSIDNGGVVNARKVGIKHANGKLVSIIDSDDWLEHNMIEKLYNAIIESNVNVSMCGRYENYEYSVKSVKQGIAPGIYRKEINGEVLKENLICLENAFFDWGVFPSYWDKLFYTDEIKPYILAVDERIPIGNDGAGVYPYMASVDSACILDECLYHYRQVETSLVHSHKNDEKLAIGFSVLYHFLDNMKQLDPDIINQWHKYVLFLMIPRLYSIVDSSVDEGIIPFGNISRESKICIYGMGIYGQRLYDFLKSAAEVEVVACVDQRYEEIANNGIVAVPIEEISRFEFDYLLIANTYESVRKKMITEAAKYVEVSKIMEPKLELIERSKGVTQIIKSAID